MKSWLSSRASRFKRSSWSASCHAGLFARGMRLLNFWSSASRSAVALKLRNASALKLAIANKHCHKYGE